jgi:hypothetical protein
MKGKAAHARTAGLTHRVIMMMRCWLSRESFTDVQALIPGIHKLCECTRVPLGDLEKPSGYLYYIKP